jgi:tRNA nucleotidyltransferase (CCA-adding enzyme)
MPYLPEAKTEALRAMPGAAILLDVFRERPGTYLVGGAVRDLMLGFAQFDFDLLVEDDAAGAAELLAQRVGGKETVHERFLTANFTSDDGRLNVDFATARTEAYPEPGALPVVKQSDVEHDLARRDFTVNAMALAIWGDRLGELTELPESSSDLMARLLRVTHDASFIDDPTRLLRLLRYGARLGFTAEPHTEELARAAVQAGAPATVSGARIRDELLDLLAERSAVVGVEGLAALGLDRALNEQLDADEYIVARAVNEQVDGVRQELLLLAICSRAMNFEQLGGWLEWLKLPSNDAQVVSQAVLKAPTLLEEVAAAASPADLERVLRPLNPETLVMAIALPRSDAAAAAKAREWALSERGGRLEISGADLREAGVSEGPAIGRALAAVLDATINGEVSGRAEQLSLALTRARNEAG